MCAGNNDEFYARARAAGEATYLLEESLRVIGTAQNHYQEAALTELIEDLRAAIEARRDGYALEAFDRAVAAVRVEEYDLGRLVR